MSQKLTVPHPRTKIDKTTLIVLSVIGVVLLIGCIVLGAALDYSIGRDGSIDSSKISPALHYVMSHPAVIFSALSKKDGYAPKMLFVGVCVIGIFALYKYSEEPKRLHRRGTEHGSAKWGDEKEIRALAEQEKKPYQLALRDENGNRQYDDKGEFVCAEVDYNIVLAKDVYLALNTKQHRLNFNTLKGRQKGLRKGVSMKAALIEEGFDPRGPKENQLVMWEAAERAEMERVLRTHGFERDDRELRRKHLDVDEYKVYQESKRMIGCMKELQSARRGDLTADRAKQLQLEISASRRRIAELEAERQSTYKAFYYSLPDKQAWVQQQLDTQNIPYRETENGFEAPECYTKAIRRIEQDFRAPRTSARDRLREDVDRMLLQSRSFDELLARLERLPIGNSCGIDKEKNIQVRRTLDTDSTAIFMPFNAREYLHEGQ